MELNPYAQSYLSSKQALKDQNNNSTPLLRHNESDIARTANFSACGGVSISSSAAPINRTLPTNFTTTKK